jgi:hypothetical protein
VLANICCLWRHSRRWGAGLAGVTEADDRIVVIHSVPTKAAVVQ